MVIKSRITSVTWPPHWFDGIEDNPVRYESKDDLAAKIDWEGGLAEAITGYGIKFTDLPEDTPWPIVQAWQRIEDSTKDLDLIYNWLEEKE